MSLELLEKWRSEAFQDSLRACGKGAHGEASIELLHGDATRVNWSDADVLFMNSTCYDERLMKTLSSISERMKQGSFCITFTKVLPSGLWKVLEFETHRMTWGSATIYIQKKVSAPGPFQFMGVAPLASTPGDFSQAAKLLATCGPGYTSDAVALDFSLEARLAWSRQPLAPLVEAAAGGGGGARRHTGEEGQGAASKK